MSNRQIYSGLQILSGDRWLVGHAVIVDNGIIQSIVPEQDVSEYLPAQQFKFSEDRYLIPGMIDLHVHGVKGKDVMDADGQSLAVMAAALAEEGITGFLATTMTTENKHLESVLQTIAGYQNEDGAMLLGVHLEGPFISPEKMGAQNGAHAQLPDVAQIQQWQILSGNKIRLVTVAPELPGAIEMMHALTATGVRVSVGHTNATFAQTQQAIAAGCTHATHLFNAMRGLHQREPGAVGALLLANEIMAELIVDGVHLHPAIVELVYKMKSRHGILLVSDAMRAKCMQDGCYDLGGQQVEVVQGKATLENGTIAGSTLRFPDAIRNMVTFTGCTIAEAIYMATYNPAKALGFTESKGSIDPGKDADLVVLDSEFNVLQTIVAGKSVYHRRHQAQRETEAQA